MKTKGCIKKGCIGLLISIVTLAAVVAVVVYILKPKWHDEYGQRFTDIAYGSLQYNTYDLYLPTDASEKDSLALILFIHGGSWMGGDKEWHHGDCYDWVQKGYATATMNYSLLTEKGVSLLTMLNEIEQCTEHIVGFAAEHGVNISQMAIAGTSAGGHLAMMFVYNHRHPLPIRFEAIKVGPSDFRILFPYDENAKTEDVENLVFSCIGKRLDVKSLSREQLDSIKLLASPIHYITDSTALPAIWGYGEKDWLVVPGNYHALQTCYDSLGASYSLIVFPNSGHNLMSDKDCSERYDSILNDYCKRYFGY